MSISILALIVSGQGIPFSHQFFMPILTITYCVVGVLVASRHPCNPIGWMFCAIGLLSALNMLSAGYSMYDQLAMTTVSLSNILLALSGGFDMSSFETSTGTTWGEFSTGQPEAAAFIIQLERLIGVGSLGFALFGAALAWTSYRQGERYVWYIMWLFPIILGLKAVVFLTVDAVGLGVYYGAAGVIAILGLFLPYRKFFPKA